MTAAWFPEGFAPDEFRNGCGLHLDAVIAALTGAAHGTFATRQLVDLGYGPDRHRRRAERGGLRRVGAGIYLAGLAEPTALGWRAIGIHAGGDGAVLGDLTAVAHLGGRVTEPADVHVIVPPGRRVRRTRVSSRDAVVHAHERTVVAGLPCLTWPRALLDIAAHRPRDVLEHAWHEAVYRRRLDPGAMERVLNDHAGEPGSVLFREMWEARLTAIGRSANKLESDLRDIVVAAGLPEPRRNVRLRIDGVVLRPDLYIPERRLAIETDGKDGHADPEQQRDDARRDALYRRLGLEPVRYAWWPVTYRTAEVQDDFARFAAWWQRTGGRDALDRAGVFRLARR